MTRRGEKKMTFFGLQRRVTLSGNIFKNKPGNLFSNVDILLGTSQRTIYMKFKKKSLTSVFFCP